MWRYPHSDINNIPWLCNLQQQYQQSINIPSLTNFAAVNISQESGQNLFQQNIQPQQNINTVQPFYQAGFPTPYPFVYTNGEQSVRFYEQFYKNCTGRSTPEVTISCDNLNSATNQIQSFDSEVVQKFDSSGTNAPVDCSLDSGSMPRGSKRNRSDSEGPSDANCKRGLQVVKNSGEKPSARSPDNDVMVCSTGSPQTSVIDLTGPSTSTSVMEQCKENPNRHVVQRKFFVTSYGREQRKYRAHSKHSCMKFSVASYNVLSQRLLEDNRYLYRHCDDGSLRWENRSSRILNQISQNHPDVLCLQEVEEIHLESFFAPELAKKGYDVVYKKRTGGRPDGCAVFYKTDLFTLDANSKVEYLKKGAQYLDRDNVGLVLLLSLRKSPKTKLCVATTHLLFNPKRGDVKLAQLQVLFTEIDKLASKKKNVKPWKSSYHPVIFCGDLNLEPKSDLYDFIIRGSLLYKGLMCRDMSGQAEGRGGGNDRLMGHFILPEELGISDQCQYEEMFTERFRAYNMKKKQENNVKSLETQVEEVVVVEDGEIIDEDEDEKEGLSTKVSSSNPVDDCIILNKSNDANKISDDDLACVTSEASTSKSPDSYSQLMDMTMKNKQQLAAYAAKLESETDFEPVVAKHCSHNKGKLSHQFNFVSVYAHEYKNKHNKLRTEVTTNHGRANCTVDYIFYSVDDKEVKYGRNGSISTTQVKEGKLKLLEKLELFVDEELNDDGGLPNEGEGSDHIMLLAKFQLKFK